MYGKKLRELRDIEGWTQEEVAKKLGVSKQTYSHYENEKRKPGLKTIRKLAEVYQVNIDDIFAEHEHDFFTSLPIVGSISCGDGVMAYEDIEGYEDIPNSWIKGAEHFLLRAKGDSMVNARIEDGDLLLIRKQETFENGEIMAVLVDNEAVLKRIYRADGVIILQSENTKYPPRLITNASDIRIIGKLKMNLIRY
ncbi:LexA family protein [Cytobacillus firmus]|uniref:LexA family protein n=1 Tax=Cytobacillus firmus TaxID=1399 RepID=UPI0018CD3326|nr:XRE family transcriptional regulator [Cytobacillus firmus]MBG9548321.1 repressor [Cytobacillus firmus]MBG9600829.1 repressor [Cytobacillus firmus]MBG9657849.1 repressor [Cytobacillus firmus]MED1904858.1 XRE family transcriptional regulator [Cytobacillus firmus]MED1938906.1 XRE family transcriptional regulator [Cytobacillus firmus]